MAYRKSTQSWRELLQQLKRQGLQTAPWHTSNTVENFASDVVESDSHPFRFLVFAVDHAVL
jgi:hypothetical protein